MNTFRSLLFFSAAVTLLASSSLHAEQAKRLSPHETISTVIDKNRVTLVYGRPYAKHPETGKVRTIWGGDLVPAGKVWRLGSDEATLFITEKPILLGGATIPAGAYTLAMLYETGGNAKLIVDKRLGQWGVPYKEGSELVRIDLTKAAAEAPSDQLRLNLTANASGGGGIFKITWGDTQYTAPITLAN